MIPSLTGFGIDVRTSSRAKSLMPAIFFGLFFATVICSSLCMYTM
jgi:hypothetical protein